MTLYIFAAMVRHGSVTRAPLRQGTARLAAADPHRECRADHLPRAAAAVRQRAGGARGAAGPGPPRRPQRAAAGLPGRAGGAGAECRRPHRRPACCRPTTPTIRRRWPRSRTRRRSSTCVGDVALLAAPGRRHRRRAQRLGQRPPAGAATSPGSSARPGSWSSPASPAASTRAAHRGALDSGTVAVVAGGVDIVYPPEQRGAAAARSRGAARSSPSCRSAPSRRPAISRAATGSSPASRSASWWSRRRCVGLADHRAPALEQGREVFAVPGSPLDPRCRGTNDLIRAGRDADRERRRRARPALRGSGRHRRRRTEPPEPRCGDR